MITPVGQPSSVRNIPCNHTAIPVASKAHAAKHNQGQPNHRARHAGFKQAPGCFVASKPDQQTDVDHRRVLYADQSPSEDCFADLILDCAIDTARAVHQERQQAVYDYINMAVSTETVTRTNVDGFIDESIRKTLKED